MWGDPHFKTLDGLEYTFNGYGEYTLITKKNDFELQARLGPWVMADGKVVNATAIVGLAAEQKGYPKVEVLLAPNRRGEAV